MRTYQGSCHCGRIRFEAEGQLDEAIECNCSMCQRKGAKMWFVPEAAFRMPTPEENLATYTFNTHRIKHHFCPNCGIHVFGQAKGGEGKPMVSINVRCLENVDIEALPIRRFDGRKL